MTHSWAFWGEDTAGALEHEGQDEEVDREREDESGNILTFLGRGHILTTDI